MIPRKKQLVAWLVVLASVAAVLLSAARMSPVREGTSAAFWESACDVTLETNDHEHMGDFYQPRDDWYIYYIQGFHGQSLFRVSRQQAVADFAEVVRRVKVLASEESPSPKVRLAAAVLEQNHLSSPLTPDQFLSLLRQERLKALRDRDRSDYERAVSDEQAFAERWSRVRRYWANVFLECAFFAGLGLFALWPWLHGEKRGWIWSLHLGLLPVLLMLPYYCGYAIWTFTSAGPSGGVLYPWVIVWFRDFPVWTDADQWLLEHFPRVLEPLSQPLGPMLSISGGRPLGPVAALLLGAGVALLVLLGFKFGSPPYKKAGCAGGSQPNAAPNGGSATPLGNSGAAEAPPSEG